MIFTEEMNKRTEEADVCVRSYLPEIKGHAKMRTYRSAMLEPHQTKVHEKRLLHNKK